MKRRLFRCRLLTATFLLSPLCGFNLPPVPAITGYIEGLDSDSITVVWAPVHKPDYSYEDVHETTIAAHGGRFSFDIPIGGLTMIRFEPRSKPHDNFNGDISLFMLAGERATITGKAGDEYIEYSVEGSLLSADYALVHSSKSPRMHQYNLLSESTMAEFRDLTENHPLSAERDGRLEEIKDLMVEKYSWATYPVVEYIRDNPDSELSVMLFEEIPLDSAGKYYPLLSERVRETTPGRIVYSLYEKFQIAEQYKASAAMPELQTGMQAPPFTLRTDKGEMFSLAELEGNGKYVVIDFFTFACWACHREMPRIRECVEKFGDKIEFINIISSSPDHAWHKLIADYNMDWIQLADSPDDPALIKYSVKAFPTKVLLNPDHKVEKIILGAKEDFFIELEQLYDSLSNK